MSYMNNLYYTTIEISFPYTESSFTLNKGNHLVCSPLPPQIGINAFSPGKMSMTAMI